MTVIVNELEVVLAPPAAAPPQTDPNVPPAAPVEPTPGALELAALLERRARQALRLFAH